MIDSSTTTPTDYTTPVTSQDTRTRSPAPPGLATRSATTTTTFDPVVSSPTSTSYKLSCEQLMKMLNVDKLPDGVLATGETFIIQVPTCLRGAPTAVAGPIHPATVVADPATVATVPATGPGDAGFPADAGTMNSGHGHITDGGSRTNDDVVSFVDGRVSLGSAPLGSAPLANAHAASLRRSVAATHDYAAPRPVDPSDAYGAPRPVDPTDAYPRSLNAARPVDLLPDSDFNCYKPTDASNKPLPINCNPMIVVTNSGLDVNNRKPAADNPSPSTDSRLRANESRQRQPRPLTSAYSTLCVEHLAAEDSRSPLKKRPLRANFIVSDSINQRQPRLFLSRCIHLYIHVYIYYVVSIYEFN